MMLRILLFFTLISPSTTQLFAAGQNNLILRQLPCPRSFSRYFTPVTGKADAQAKPTQITEKQLSDYFAALGVTFPAGAYLKHDLQKNEILHLNTKENHVLFEQIGGTVPHPDQVMIDALFVELPKSEIEKLCRIHATPAPTSDDILNLWKSGKGKLLYALSTQSRCGVYTEIMSAKEEIFGTEFLPGKATDAPPLPQPDTLETREVGVSLHVATYMSMDAKFADLCIVAEVTDLLGHNHSRTTAKLSGEESMTVSIPQPQFHCKKINSNILVKSGVPEVIGGLLNPAGDAFTYLFLTASPCNATEKPFQTTTDHSNATPTE